VTSGSVRIHPAALEEAETATDWYRQRSRRAAEMFLDELDSAIKRIGQHSRQFSVYEFGTRRIVLRRFPYLVIFRETASGMEIIAVAHGRRRPGYWRDRFE
jgi:plasmid stabilization system protein ParE